MSSVRLIGSLKETRLRCFTTQGAVTLTGSSRGATVQLLSRLARDNIVLRLKRGIWLNLLVPSLRLEESIPFLTAPWLSYVSLYSALSEHGLIAEVPPRIYAVSNGRPSRIKTPLGIIEIHHIPASVIWGFEVRSSGEGSFPLATPEKAYLDTLYLASVPRSPIRMPGFRHRPKLDSLQMKRFIQRWKSTGPTPAPFLGNLKNRRSIWFG